MKHACSIQNVFDKGKKLAFRKIGIMLIYVLNRVKERGMNDRVAMIFEMKDGCATLMMINETK